MLMRAQDICGNSLAMLAMSSCLLDALLTGANYFSVNHDDAFRLESPDSFALSVGCEQRAGRTFGDDGKRYHSKFYA